MHLDPWTFALQTINVLILVWLLAHFLFRPVAAIIAARRAASDALMTDAEAARGEGHGRSRRLGAAAPGARQ